MEPKSSASTSSATSATGVLLGEMPHVGNPAEVGGSGDRSGTPTMTGSAATTKSPTVGSADVLDRDWDVALRGPRMSEATGRVIFKYQMPVLEEFTMQLPAGAEIIRMQDQGGMFWLWAVVDTAAPLEVRRFRAFKTGAKIPDGLSLRYLGFCAVFVQMELGLYIFEEA